MLHITAWYPSKAKPFEAVWIKRLIDSVTPDCDIYHLSVASSETLKVRHFRNGKVKHRVWELPTRRWLIIELLNMLLLACVLIKKRFKNDFDVINFHIAYPQLVFWRVLKYLVNKPVVVSEHWSAYHFNFGVVGALPRIEQIFRQDLPLITVSHSLADDLRQFSKNSAMKIFRVPNVVDSKEFCMLRELPSQDSTLLMASQWKVPKLPAVLLTAFAALVQKREFSGFTLRIAGYGPLLPSMQELCRAMGMEDKIVFLGPLTATSLAVEMNRCSAFLHCSEYETFSVVCAEALCCGAPVIASSVGGIREFVNSANGILVPQNTCESWVNAIEELKFRTFNRRGISASAQEQFSPQIVRRQYLNVIDNICGIGR